MEISGSGNFPGGDYNEEITISGSGNVNGNASCTGLSISGSGHVNGNLFCKGNAKISGSGTVDGNLEAIEVAISGSGKVNGTIKCEKCSVSGMMNTEGITTNELNVSGMINVGGDISAEDAVIHGAVNADGLINAERIDIIFDSASRADSIGGSRVKIRRKGVISGFISKLFKGKNSECFKVKGSIEGDVIDIEYVMADSVIGNEINIGEGCRIGSVTCTGTINVSPDAVVESLQK